MTRSHKILILVPPLLIGITMITVLFSWQHHANQQAIDEAGASLATSTDFIVTDPVPLPPITIEPTPSPDEPVQSDIDDMVACPMDAKMCPDGSFVGRTGPDCEFAACPDTSPDTSDEFIACAPGERLVDACIEIFAPVCGLQEVQCVTEPCDPVPVEFPNSCYACQDASIIGYTEGTCEA